VWNESKENFVDGAVFTLTCGEARKGNAKAGSPLLMVTMLFSYSLMQSDKLDTFVATHVCQTRETVQAPHGVGDHVEHGEESCIEHTQNTQNKKINDSNVERVVKFSISVISLSARSARLN
jgi:hypothetical protein